MRTYKDITAGSIGTRNDTNRSTPTRDVPASALADDAELKRSPDTRFKRFDHAEGGRSNDPADRRNGPL